MASKSKGRGGIKTKDWAKHLRPDGKRTHNKAVRKDGKKQITKAKKEEDEEVFVESEKKSQYLNFINELIAENFSEAHKYLRAIIHQKIKTRIKSQLSKPLF